MADIIAKNKRTTTKRSLTHFKNYFEALKAQDDLEINIIELETRLENALKFLDDFNTAQSEIESEDGDYDTNINTVHEKERLDFEKAYYNLTSEVKKFIFDKSAASADADRSSAHTNNSNNSNRSGTLCLSSFDSISHAIFVIYRRIDQN
ncbi:unnamed protein product [Ceutorhynchus assimilis]|uniref:Uncharacterized protein n=1 Tax=Ceutorhynchus assimilis TaxID=467358 RepID=A0A9N9MVJ9_9CUCU|nr:unnamed protein product [Ceutorhynchus assimilis]